MKLRWTIILFTFNILLLWGVLEQFASPPADRQFNSQVRSFLPLSRSDWDGMGIKTPNSDWSVSRDRWGHWWLKTPYDWPAKEGIISRMNGYLLTLQVDSAFATSDLGRVGQSLHSYGLDNPRAILQVSSGSKTLSYKIGNTTPLGNKVYVLSSSQDEIWVVDAGINEFLGYKPLELKQEGFFPFNLMELESADVDFHGSKLHYERIPGSNSWQLKTDDDAIMLAPGSWDDWVKKLSNAPIIELSQSDLAQESLKTPLGLVNFQTLYGRRTLYLGDLDKTGSNRLVQWEGQKSAFLVPVSCLGVLKVENFLEKSPLSVNPSDINTIDWKNEAGTLSLRKLESGQWLVGMTSANAQPADADAVHKLLLQIESIQGTPMIGKKSESSKIDLSLMEKIRIESSGKTIELTIERQKDKTVITSAEGHLIYFVDDWPSAPKATELTDKTLFDPSMAGFSSFAFTILSPVRHKVSYLPETPQGKAFIAIMKNNPKIERWLAQSDIKKFGSPNAQLEIVVSEQILKMDLWSPTASNSNWIGHMGDKYFEAGKDLNNFLDALLIL